MSKLLGQLTMGERLLPLPYLTIEALMRFWSYTDRRSEEECWPWLKSLYDKRYGRFCYNKWSYTATRVAYFIEYHVDPGSFYVCHTCNNTICVNPRHLYLGTNAENQQQSHDQNRHNQDGELNPQAKLRDADVLNTRERLNAGASRAALAKEYLVNITSIHLIARGETWKHLL